MTDLLEDDPLAGAIVHVYHQDGEMKGMIYRSGQYVRGIRVIEHDADQTILDAMDVVVPTGKWAGKRLIETPDWFRDWAAGNEAPRFKSWAPVHAAARILKRNVGRVPALASGAAPQDLLDEYHAESVEQEDDCSGARP